MKGCRRAAHSPEPSMLARDVRMAVHRRCHVALVSAITSCHGYGCRQACTVVPNEQTTSLHESKQAIELAEIGNPAYAGPNRRFLPKLEVSVPTQGRAGKELLILLHLQAIITDERQQFILRLSPVDMGKTYALVALRYPNTMAILFITFSASS